MQRFFGDDTKAVDKNKNKVGLHKTKKSFYSKRNGQQNEKASSGMGENICQTHIR